MSDKIKPQEVAEQVAKKRGRPKGSGGNSRPDKTVQTEPGDNAKYIRHAMRLSDLPKCDMSNLDEVQKRIRLYFQIAEEDDMKPAVTGLALALGIDRKNLWAYRIGQIGKNEEVRNSLKKACAILDQMMNDYMQNGKINPVSGIFLMKNNFGYTDKQEVEVVSKSVFGEDAESIKQLESKYAESALPPAEAESAESE